MHMDVTKKRYERPAMRVFELEQQLQLLAGSGGLDNPGDYGNGGNPFAG